MNHYISSVLLLSVFFALQSSAENFIIHVHGDSNSQGLLPGGSSHYSLDIGAGRNAPLPWPAVMERILKKRRVWAEVINHSESGRRLVGRSANSFETNGVGRKDGRVALQQIVTMMMNQGGEQNQNVALIINLGTNDLQDPDIGSAQLRDRFLKHVLTIFTNPQLQFNLLQRIDQSQYSQLTQFFTELNGMMSDEIATGTEVQGLSQYIENNRPLIRQLFQMIMWRIALVPPVVVQGHPYGAFPSSELSQQWPQILETVTNFFDSEHVFVVHGAQNFATPTHDEFGGSVHLSPEDHLVFGENMVESMLNNPHVNLQPFIPPSNSNTLSEELLRAVTSNNLNEVRRICELSRRFDMNILHQRGISMFMAIAWEPASLSDSTFLQDASNLSDIAILEYLLEFLERNGDLGPQEVENWRIQFRANQEQRAQRDQEQERERIARIQQRVVNHNGIQTIEPMGGPHFAWMTNPQIILPAIAALLFLGMNIIS